MAALTYAQAGVDREAADRLVEKIGVMARATCDRRVKASIGGYASLFALDSKRWIAASTDGVGTKLKLAFRLGDHRTVGIDLVAMSVNDLLCVGAEPLFFLDYFATGRLEPGVAEQVLAGIVDGCRQSSCALVGGETAEMPEFYASGEYDLGGFAVGSVDPRRVLPRRDVKVGDALVGIASSGCHSNGFSLLRRLLEGEPESRARELLTPTRIYAKSLGAPIRSGVFKGLAHITGSGFHNVPRMSSKVSYELELPPAAERPAIFDWVARRSGLPFSELAATFNLGLGMVAVVDPRKAETAIRALTRSGERAWIVGAVTRRHAAEGSGVRVVDGASEAWLSYE